MRNMSVKYYCQPFFSGSFKGCLEEVRQKANALGFNKKVF